MCGRGACITGIYLGTIDLSGLSSKEDGKTNTNEVVLKKIGNLESGNVVSTGDKFGIFSKDSGQRLDIAGAPRTYCDPEAAGASTKVRPRIKPKPEQA